MAFAVEWKAEGDSHRNQVRVFTVGDNGWTNIQCFPRIPTLQHNDGVCLCGTLNWLAVINDTIKQFEIVSLDMGKVTYRKLLLPHVAH